MGFKTLSGTDRTAGDPIQKQTLNQGCQTDSTKGCVAAGFCSNQETAHQTELV